MAADEPVEHEDHHGEERGDLPDDAGTALLIGHNPGVAELVDLLSGEGREMRTSSIAARTPATPSN